MKNNVQNLYATYSAHIALLSGSRWLLNPYAGSFFVCLLQSAALLLPLLNRPKTVADHPKNSLYKLKATWLKTTHILTHSISSLLFCLASFQMSGVSSLAYGVAIGFLYYVYSMFTDECLFNVSFPSIKRPFLIRIKHIIPNTLVPSLRKAASLSIMLSIISIIIWLLTNEASAWAGFIVLIDMVTSVFSIVIGFDIMHCIFNLYHSQLKFSVNDAALLSADGNVLRRMITDAEDTRITRFGSATPQVTNQTLDASILHSNNFYAPVSLQTEYDKVTLILIAVLCAV